MKRPRLRVVFFNAVLLLVSLLFAAGFAEIAVRAVRPQQLILIRPDLWQPADTVGWLRRPNVDATVNTGQGTVRLITDHDGFRIGTAGRVAGVPVLLLGDSFVEALQVEHEESLAGLLESELSQTTGQTVAVRNAGIGGWSPSQYLIRARSVLPQENYRLVITAIYIGNDIRTERTDYVAPRQSVERHRFHLPRQFNRAALVDAALMPLNDALEEHSHLYIMLRNRLNTLRMKVGMSPLYFPREFLKEEATSDRWGITADVCADIKALAEAHGARALFVLIPTDYQVDPVMFNNYVRGFGIDTTTVDLEQPTRRMAEELRARGIEAIDALPRFRELRASGEILYGHVDPHLSAAGHRALAELITPAATMLLQENE